MLRFEALPSAAKRLLSFASSAAASLPSSWSSPSSLSCVAAAALPSSDRLSSSPFARSSSLPNLPSRLLLVSDASCSCFSRRAWRSATASFAERSRAERLARSSCATPVSSDNCSLNSSLAFSDASLVSESFASKSLMYLCSLPTSPSKRHFVSASSSSFFARFALSPLTTSSSDDILDLNSFSASSALSSCLAKLAFNSSTSLCAEALSALYEALR
mmetsp:Transcript_58584/g.166367  ORF Transcript_58584/g.166367 Transcript_58584/m.166367 type:complete len:217 (-) Transcript_58584:614-1264(-)